MIKEKSSQLTKLKEMSDFRKRANSIRPYEQRN